MILSSHNPYQFSSTTDALMQLQSAAALQSRLAAEEKRQQELTYNCTISVLA